MENKTLWAPWRIGYITGLDKDNKDCFFCHYLAHPEADEENHVLWRTDHCLAVLNRYPYNNGHMLVAPKRHVEDLSDLSDVELLEMMRLVDNVKTCVRACLQPHGYNIGINLGRTGGAGLPGHLHTHLVPRWRGDTNFMSVCGGTDVISQSMVELLALLRKTSQELGLPDLKVRS